MKDRACSQCGRTVRVRIDPRRSPRSPSAQSGGRFALAEHDLCRQCWQGMIDAARAREDRFRAWRLASSTEGVPA